MSAAKPNPVHGVFFGTNQDRKLFPFSFAPDRLGNELAREAAPNVGPSSYDNHKIGSIQYEIEKKPESKRGYGLCARTAARFPPCSKTGTPSPQQYQPDQSRSRVPPPGKTPFNSNTERFKSLPRTVEDSPGPGNYAHDRATNRKVSWPMCFGGPDWSRLPQPEKLSLRVKLDSEKEFLKHRSRMAYLSLYYED
ncbi:Protein pitchfork [Larimichthys crocea]|uniref:Uncharacterized protein n=1 Tax=Larimichthys crocea TaxID=215358 RepID=A0ACD3RA69_LARCR|nr:Protein pitchfork [Larimichthys crocea]